MVLGATGHLGCAITRALLGRGERVTAIVRRAVLPPNMHGVAARFVQIEDDEPLERHARGHRMIIDAAAPHPVALRETVDPSALAEAHARRVVETGLPIIHLSSWAAEIQKPADATANYGRRTHPYFEVKKQLEERFLSASALPVSVVRLTMCIGPWDVRARYLCAIPQLVAGDHPNVPEANLNLIDVRDVAQDIVDTPFKPGLRSLWGHDVTFAAAMAHLIRETGATPPIGSVPSETAVVALVGWETLQLSPPGPPALGMMLVHEMLPGLRATAADPRPRALRPLEVSLRDAVSWYRLLGYC